MRFTLVPSVIRIDIPALSALVEYLKDTRKAQQEIDAATLQITALTAKLKKSSDALSAAVTGEKKND